ncbi:MAG TPA: amino acid permease, partial [Flavitalea sp.]|nr:amino acid permease [Flavitalea sp.]
MSQPQLHRKLGLWTTISIVAGGIIGSGIFMKPAIMAGQLGSPGLLISVWIIAGLITLFGALTNAEVAAMFPETGGQYIFFQKMYGDFIAFLYGWAGFAVFNTAGASSIAYVMAQYLEYFVVLPRFTPEVEKSFSFYIPFIGTIFPLQNAGVKSVTILTILTLTLVNYISVRFGGALQVIFTAMKVAAIILLIGGILFSGDGNFMNLVTVDSSLLPHGRALFFGFIAATGGAFWAYDGWNNITFVAGEVKNPQSVIPKSLFIGITTAIVLYVLINIAYLYVLPIGVMSKSVIVASDAAVVVMGGVGGACIAVLVMLSTFGSTNANLLAIARVSFAMAREQRFFSFVGKVHPRFNTPGNALVLHAIWASLLVCSGSFDMLTDMLIFVSWLFYGMSAVGLFVLRKKFPDISRPFKVPGYPLVPIVFCAFTALFLVITLYNDVTNYTTGKTPVVNAA